MTAHVVAALLPAALLAGGFLSWLRGAGYAWPVAVTLSVLAFSQAGMIAAVSEPGHSLWLALGVGAVAASASAFAEREDARRIILVGSSLAAIQLCDPMGGLVAAGLLPATIAARQARDGPHKTAGLYALLLFLPVMAAFVLLYLSRAQHIDLARLLARPSLPDLRLDARWRYSPALGLVAVLVPLFSELCRRRSGRPALFVAIAVIASALFDGFSGVIRDPVALVAVAAPLTMVMLASSPSSPVHDRYALMAAALCAGLSWLILFWFLSLPIASF